ncbi:MAG: methyltransferase domain-containing protein [Anaerolineae bacterium]|nr:class I SAM-dependent methyltransferase [Thermoflexales bacterium]MDW8408698.1 methyltransferase domain-containing protein [Anaerolineae bacterium]
MSIQEHFRREYARRKPGWRHSLFIFQELVDRHVQPGAHLLDIGCGHADFLRPIYTKTPHVVGCDPDHAALMLNGTIGLRVAGLAEHLPFTDEQFDAAVLVFVLEHLRQPARAFGEIQRVLKPGGKVIFLTPNAWNYATWFIRAVPHRMRDRLAQWLHGRQPGDTYPVQYRINTVRRIEQVLSRVGFRRVELLLHGDPTYLGVNRPLFALACAIERVLEWPALQGARVHILGAYEKAL